MEHDEGHGAQGAETQEDQDMDQLAERAAALQLESAASHASRSPGLRIQIPTPFEDVPAEEVDEDMATASPYVGGPSVAAAPALPQPPRFQGRTMQDRRTFMRQYEAYLGATNALQTQWGGAFAMPVGACIESRTKRMVTRYEFNQPSHLISEDQWIGYFRQAHTPSHIDYASVDEAMKKLQMKTTWPEPESRMMNLQADLEAILEKFNLTEVAFDHEQRRIVKYLANALAPASFKAVIVTKLTLHENKTYKNEVVPFCSWVTKLMREFMTWEHAAQASAGARNPEQNPQHQRSSSRGNHGGRGASGGRGQGAGRGGSGDRSGNGDERGGQGGRTGGDAARSSHVIGRGARQLLVYIFDPYATDGTMARYQADNLQRWALSLLSFRYVIEHVPGEANA